ncbi:hypothetical protein ACFLS9_04280 [Bacteroidota bacterium]
MKTFLLLAVIALLNLSCTIQSPPNAKDVKDISPTTININLSEYSRSIYVSYTSGNDLKGTGSINQPFATIGFTLQDLKPAENEKIAVLVSTGEYFDHSLTLSEGVHLLGGFSPGNWYRDIDNNRSIINGSGKGRILSAANNSVIDGFTITGGVIRDKGGAILCDGTSPRISNNIFSGNKTLKPEPWNPKFWHETANDGGAVYGRNGASPVIKNNLFVNNKTENGRGAAVAFDGNCKPKIIENVFLQNVAGLDDPMRSSDAGAVSIFRWCDTDIIGNVFLGNRSLSNNDGGAVFIALWSSGRINNNVFVDNACDDDAGAVFVGGQEHRYDAPLDPLPPRDKFYVSMANNVFMRNFNPSMNSGVMRFTMESRGDFKNNITAYNNGIYFQRSEVEVVDNVIMDNFLFIETKEGLGIGTVKDNLIWADFDLQIEANIINNNMKYIYEGNGNYSKRPVFDNDGFKLDVIASNSIRYKNYSVLSVLNKFFLDNELVNRVVKVGEKWGVVKSNDAESIQVWGDFSAVTELEILPTFSLKN